VRRETNCGIWYVDEDLFGTYWKGVWSGRCCEWGVGVITWMVFRSEYRDVSGVGVG
jgi:hypothetical protein